MAITIRHLIILQSEPMWVYFILIGLLMVFLAIMLRKQFWERWVDFVASKDGCYFRQQYALIENFKIIHIDHFIFVPWENIGEVYVDEINDGDGRSKSVIVKIKVSEIEWEEKFSNEKYLPKWASFFKSKMDNLGYREFVLGNHMQNVEKTKTEILKYRN